MNSLGEGGGDRVTAGSLDGSCLLGLVCSREIFSQVTKKRKSNIQLIPVDIRTQIIMTGCNVRSHTQDMVAHAML